MSGAPPPSSFDSNADFYEESRWQKFKRRILEEPLIPLGCALTCWALLEAGRSMRMGDSTRTNRMFRRRIYAQGFTILAMLAGSKYWESDRDKRKEFNELSEERKRKEKHEAWIKELEIRAQEDEELVQQRKQIMEQRRASRKNQAIDSLKGKVEAASSKVGSVASEFVDDPNEQSGSGSHGGNTSTTRSVLEVGERRSRNVMLTAAMSALDGQWR